MASTRDVLLDSAVQHLEDQGLDGLTLRSIARASGVSHAAPARHFDGLGSLLSAVVARSFRELTAALDERVEGIEDPIDRLRLSGHAYFEFALANPAPYELMFRPERLDRASEDYVVAGSESYGRLGDLVADAQRAGWKADVDHAELTALVWAGIHGLASLSIQGALPFRAGTDLVDLWGRDVLGLHAPAPPDKETP